METKDSEINKTRKKLGWPEYIFGFAVLAVVLSFLVFYLVDLRNAFGLRDMLFDTGPAYFFFTYLPFFFQHWGRNSGIAEILQWSLLGGAALVMAFCAGRMYEYHKRFFAFTGLMAVAFFLMLLEDAGNIRHVLMSYVQVLFDEPDQGIAGTTTEFLYFAALAAVPLYALIRYWSVLKEFSGAKLYILIGFVSYGLAALLSFIGTAFEGLLDRNFYNIAGERVYNLALRLGDAELQGIWEAWRERSFDIGFFLLDSMIEENIELIGAGAFLAGAVALFAYVNNNKVKKEV